MKFSLANLFCNFCKSSSLIPSSNKSCYMMEKPIQANAGVFPLKDINLERELVLTKQQYHFVRETNACQYSFSDIV